VYPSGQVHVKLPGVLLQTATASQPPSFDAHSSISTQVDIILCLEIKNLLFPCIAHEKIDLIEKILHNTMEKLLLLH